jgi:hypothetical protein
VNATAAKLQQDWSAAIPSDPADRHGGVGKRARCGRIDVSRPGRQAPGFLDWELAESAEYTELLSIEEDIRSIGPAPYDARVGEGEPVSLRAGELEAFIADAGRKACRSPGTSSEK